MVCKLIIFLTFLSRYNNLFQLANPLYYDENMAVKWLDIHSRVTSMIRSVFESAAVVHPEMHSPFSRAMYGLDVMLDSSFQPKLLEVCTNTISLHYLGFLFIIISNDYLW